MRKKVLIVIAILLLIFFGKAIVTALNLSPFLLQVFFNKNIDLKKTQDRINVLLLGVGGGVHQGPDLTDTIIFASMDIKNNKVILNDFGLAHKFIFKKEHKKYKIVPGKFDGTLEYASINAHNGAGIN